VSDLDPAQKTAAELEKEANSWRPPAQEAPKYEAFAKQYMLSLLPGVLRAHAGTEFTEHHSSGLLDPEDVLLPAGSTLLKEKLTTRLWYRAMAYCLTQQGRHKEACGAFGRAALCGRGWAEALNSWEEALVKCGRGAEVPGVWALGAARGAWPSTVQRPTGLYVRRLEAKPIWDAAEIPAARALEAAYPAILNEFKRLSEGVDRWKPINCHDESLVSKGQWTDFKFISNGQRHSVNCARCPETWRVLSQLPEVATMVSGTAIFSRMAGGTVIKPHCGATNTRLRLHLGLDVPKEGGPRPRMRVGGEWVEWQAGKVLCFDDSFEHEVEHLGSKPRVILLVDLWHPDLGDNTGKGRARVLHGDGLRRFRAAAGGAFEPHRVVDSEVRFLEQVLRAVGGVREAATKVHLQGEPGSPGGATTGGTRAAAAGAMCRQFLLAYVECSPCAERETVCELCSLALKKFGLSSLIMTIRGWPRTAQGEIDRGRLPPPPKNSFG